MRGRDGRTQGQMLREKFGAVWRAAKQVARNNPQTVYEKHEIRAEEEYVPKITYRPDEAGLEEQRGADWAGMTVERAKRLAPDHIQAAHVQTVYAKVHGADPGSIGSVVHSYDVPVPRDRVSDHWFETWLCTLAMNLQSDGLDWEPWDDAMDKPTEWFKNVWRGPPPTFPMEREEQLVEHCARTLSEDRAAAERAVDTLLSTLNEEEQASLLEYGWVEVERDWELDARIVRQTYQSLIRKGSQQHNFRGRRRHGSAHKIFSNLHYALQQKPGTSRLDDLSLTLRFNINNAPTFTVRFPDGDEMKGPCMNGVRGVREYPAGDRLASAIAHIKNVKGHILWPKTSKAFVDLYNEQLKKRERVEHRSRELGTGRRKDGGTRIEEFRIVTPPGAGVGVEADIPFATEPDVLTVDLSTGEAWVSRGDSPTVTEGQAETIIKQAWASLDECWEYPPAGMTKAIRENILEVLAVESDPRRRERQRQDAVRERIEARMDRMMENFDHDHPL